MKGREEKHMASALAALLLLLAAAPAAPINVAWTAPTTKADGTPLNDLAGYKVFADALRNPPQAAPTPAAVAISYGAAAVGADVTAGVATAAGPTAPYPLVRIWVAAFNAGGSQGAFSNAIDVDPNLSLPPPPPPPPPPTGLSPVAAYGFSEGAGATAADSSGRGNHGAVVGATWISAGKFGSALSFDGSGARVTVPDSASLHPTTAFTLEAWVSPTTTSAAWRDVVYKANDNFYLEGSSGGGVGAPAAGGTFSSGGPLYGLAALPANAWSHLAATYDSITLRLYVDGAQVASRAQAGGVAVSANPLQIGGDDLFGQFFQGAIDEVRVYDVALTAAQIQADMAAAVTAVPPTADTQPPTAPSSLAADAAGAAVALSWIAATDNVAVASYSVERCSGAGCTAFAPLGTTATTTFSDATVAVAVSYSYRVRAADAAGNAGPWSDVDSVIVPDTKPPTAPASLTATAVSVGQVALSWPASTDDVAVTGYSVERCQGAGCTAFARVTVATTQTYGDSGLSPSTSYSYRVQATDLVGNLGPYSPTATATTLASPSGLVAVYGFNEGAGTVLSDASGYGNHGTIIGATWTTAGKFGSALTFNGNSLVTIPDAASLHLTTACTVEAWMWPTVVSSSWRNVVYKGDDCYFLDATSTRKKFPAGGGTIGGAAIVVYGKGVLKLNAWTHLAMTYDGSRLKLLVNGVEVANAAVSGVFSATSNPLQIGGNSLFGEYFSGKIDEVKVYNVARTAAQIKADMNAP